MNFTSLMRGKRTFASRMLAALMMVSVAMPAFVPVARAQTAVAPTVPIVPPQFNLTGFIQNAVLDTNNTLCVPAHPSLAGGTITVNGQIIVVPCNTILQLPATSMTFAELFLLAPGSTPAGYTGLSLADPLPTKTGINAALPSYEVNVFGNVMGGVYTAGLIYVTQQALNTSHGMVNFIDYATGEMHIGGIPNVSSPTDVRVRLNDPVGRYGKSHGAPGTAAEVIEPEFDARFTADTSNPTIRSVTGFPMCVPRTAPGVEDPLCPTRNRPIAPNCQTLATNIGGAFAGTPTGQYCKTFAMDLPPATIGGALPACAGGVCKTDPTRQAPIMVGDSITYSGTLKIDPVSGPYISAHTVLADVGIYTQPGVKPAYVAIDVLIMGGNAAGAATAGIAQEARGIVKVEGFTTDPSTSVDIYSVNVDPASGATAYQLQGSQPGNVDGVFGRWRYAPGNKALFVGNITREAIVVSRTLCGSNLVACAPPAAPQLMANGIAAGQYQAPIAEFIFPENIGIGAPTVPMDFQNMAFLYCGNGPLQTATMTVPVKVGQLDPAPWALPMAAPLFASTLCPTARTMPAAPTAFNLPPVLTVNATPVIVTAPVAVASAAQTVSAGAAVTLASTGSHDTNTPLRALTYSWSQLSGPAVAINGANTATASFTAPAVSATSALVFRLTVSNGTQSATANTTVTVNPLPVPVVTVAASTINANALTAVAMSATSNPATGVTYSWTQISGPTVTLTGATTANASFTAPAGPATLVFQIKVTNALGAFASVPVTVNVAADTVSVFSAVWSTKAAKVTVVAQSTLPAAPTSLAATIFNGATVAVAQTTMTPRAAGAGQCLGAVGACWTLGPINLAKPTATTTVTVTSNRGGKVNVPVTVGP